ncbi:MAG TPA: phosphatase PAP2 family protein [Mycobacteriales bacterium]|nr:phosphatase PAP2 family protein [Mycobacteriales bacterium]
MTTQLEDARATGSDLSPWRLADARTRHRRRRMLLLVVVAFTLFVGFAGVPTGREWLTLWILVTLLAAVGGDVAVWRRAVVRDWLPLLAVLFAYDLLRGVANEVGGALFDLDRWRSNPSNVLSVARAHLTEPLGADRWMFGGHVPTVWLQEHLYDPGVAHWWDRIAVPVYLSHFLVSLILAIWLWCVNYPLFRRYLATFVTLTMVTLMTYLIYPAAPPWMAALNGRIPEVDRVVQATLSVLGGETVNTAVEKGAAYSNPVAAIPSLHAAIPMMLALFFWSRARWWLKGVLALYAVAMGLTLVYSGEHYVVDVLLGWVYAAGAVIAVRAFWRTRTAVPAAASED